MREFLKLWLCVIALLLPAAGLRAATSEGYDSPSVSARLISAENGIAPGSGTLSLGLDLRYAAGWKGYWRSPGEVGLPTEIDWDGSQNFGHGEILWPAPERYTAFGIENFGYSGDIVLPVRVMLTAPGEPATLRARVSLLTCADICIPHDFTLTLDLPQGGGIDRTSADAITRHAARVPDGPDASDIALTAVSLHGDALIVTARSDVPFSAPDVFPELGEDFTFGAPDIRVDPGRGAFWASLPVLSRSVDAPAPQITITDTDRALTARTQWTTDAPAPPYAAARATGPGLTQLALIAVLAFLGGLVLNAMPCVLPVLSIKLASVMAHRDRPLAQVRRGFAISALGVMAFMWALGAVVVAMQALGFSVGWGLQFQSPVFLALMVMVLTIFAANLFGLFEISLPQVLQTRLAGSGAAQNYVGDFATGAFAAVLATPCSAPFLGTAVAFALTGRALDVAVVFTALGLGLAVPYLIFAARPSLGRLLPRPGRWMLALKVVLGLLLTATALWLLWVLSGVAGPRVAAITCAFALGFGGLASLRWRAALRTALLGVLAVMPLGIAAGWTPPPAAPQLAADWTVFERRAIARLVAQGQTVFVDVTADWCLTCKANKALVLDRAPVVDLLRAPGVTAMRADWTRPNPAIARYLEQHGRFGIPFNIVYGPSAPAGIALPELLSTATVVHALDAAAGARIAAQ